MRREINREGRNRVFVQDQPVTLTLLTRLAPQLIRIHGQREELGLVSARLQRQWLDRSGGEKGAESLREVEKRFHSLRDLTERIERLEGDDRLRQERIDLLRFQGSEIDAARLQAGEEDGLKAERDVQRHVEAIGAALGGSLGLLFEEESSAFERLSMASRRLSEIAEWEEQSAVWSEESGGDVHRAAGDGRYDAPSSRFVGGRSGAVECHRGATFGHRQADSQVWPDGRGGPRLP